MSARKQLETSLNSLFAKDAEAILRLCLSKDGRPLGFDHVDMLCQLCGIPVRSPGLVDLRLAYTLLSSYYFLLDAVADGHLSQETDAVFLTHLLAGASFKLEDTLCAAGCEERLELRAVCLRYISENAASIKLEERLHGEPLILSETEDRQSIIGRSNSFLLLHELLALIYGSRRDVENISVLERLVYYLQLGDDLSDWREDFHGSRWTLLLRTCFVRQGRFLTEDQLEEYMYLGGFYEEWAGRVVRGLIEITEDLQAHQKKPALLIKLVDSQQRLLKGALTRWVETKLATSA